jgi:hypothetical protein
MTIRQEAKDAARKILDMHFTDIVSVLTEIERIISLAMDRVSGCTREQAEEAAAAIADECLYLNNAAVAPRLRQKRATDIILFYCGERSTPVPTPSDQYGRCGCGCGLKAEETAPKPIIPTGRPNHTDEWEERQDAEAKMEAPEPVLRPEEWVQEYIIYHCEA